MFESVWSILSESAFFILVGFGVAGVLNELLPSQSVTRWLSGNRARSVLSATLVGAPLPLCSCSVLPTAITLRQKGASKGATLSFLISTPETSVTSVLLTYALLGPIWAVFRPIAACVSALVAGLVENACEEKLTTTASRPVQEAVDASCAVHESCCLASGVEQQSRTFASRIQSATRYAFVKLFDDIFGWVMLGIVAAAAIQAWLPPDILSKVLGGPMQSMLLMLLIGVPLYVCAEASTPIAAVLVSQGMSPGAALVLLLVGPATNIGSLGLLHGLLGRRTMVVYLVTIMVVAVVMGLVLDGLLSGSEVVLRTRMLDEPFVPAWLKTTAATLFLVNGVATAVRYVRRRTFSSVDQGR